MDSIIFPSITKLDAKLPFYLSGVGINYRPKYLYRETGITSYMWIQVREGEGSIRLKDRELFVKKGMGAIVCPNEKHELVNQNSDWVFDWVLFRGYGMESLLDTLGHKYSDQFELNNLDYLCKKAERLMDLLKRDHAARSFDNSNAAYDFIIDAIKSIQYQQQDYEQRDKFDVVHNYIIENYNKVITLEELAEFMNISPQYFCKIFKEVFGCRVSEYINRIRILKSKELIFLNQDMKFTEIARLSGFDDASYFCAVFKKIEGCTPGEFKKSIL